MNLQKLTVGQMASINHVTQQTLRLYDKKGLLKPQMIDQTTGYRYYHITQSARLDLIQNLKLYGFTLRQIKEILENNDVASLQKFLVLQVNHIDDYIQELKRSKCAIQSVLLNYKRYQSMPQNKEIFLEFMPERYIYKYHCQVNYFDEDEIGYEYMLRQLKLHVASQKIPFSYFCNVGTIIKKEDLMQQKLFSDEVFFFVDQDNQIENTKIIPANTYVCICSNDVNDEIENIKRMMTYIKDHHYTIVGDYLCEVVVDFPALHFDNRRMFYKTQIPVTYQKQ